MRKWMRQVIGLPVHSPAPFSTRSSTLSLPEERQSTVKIAFHAALTLPALVFPRSHKLETVQLPCRLKHRRNGTRKPRDNYGNRIRG